MIVLLSVHGTVLPYRRDGDSLDILYPRPARPALGPRALWHTVLDMRVFGKKPLYLPQTRLARSIKVINALLYY